jgi:hypothetical protein
LICQYRAVILNLQDELKHSGRNAGDTSGNKVQEIKSQLAKVSNENVRKVHCLICSLFNLFYIYISYFLSQRSQQGTLSSSHALSMKNIVVSSSRRIGHFENGVGKEVNRKK